jgi:monoterpene epsilon-lactone hydrolase
MASIQWRLLKLYFQVKRVISPQPKEITISTARADLENLTKLFKPLGKFEIVKVNANGVNGEWLIPNQAEGGQVILYLHGGYYLIGSIATARNLAGNIALAARRRCLIIDYRLAPECPFPAGLEDAQTAYSWLLAQGIQPQQIVFAGDSAGGGLVLATLLALRMQGLPQPAGAVCLSPATDLSLSGESWKANAKKELVLNPYVVEQIKPLYLREVDLRDPLVSPLFGDLCGLPPLLIQVGSDEALLSDSTNFAKLAIESGVDVTLEVWPGMQHVWQTTASMVPEARKAIQNIGEFIRRLE